MNRLTLADVRANGYAVSIDESAPGVASVAAPVFDATGRCVAAMSVAGPVTRITPERVDRLIPMVQAAATASVSRKEGRRPPLAR